MRAETAPRTARYVMLGLEDGFEFPWLFLVVSSSWKTVIPFSERFWLVSTFFRRYLLSIDWLSKSSRPTHLWLHNKRRLLDFVAGSHEFK